MKNNEIITPYDKNGFKILKIKKKEISKEKNNRYNIVNQLMLNSKLLLPDEYIIQSTKNPRYKKFNIKQLKRNFNPKNKKQKIESETPNNKNRNKLHSEMSNLNPNSNKNPKNMPKNKSSDLIINKELKKKNSLNKNHKDKMTGDNPKIIEENQKINGLENNNVLTLDKKYNLSRNEVPKINRSTFDIISKSDITDKTYKNWNELKKNYIKENKDRVIQKKPEEKNLSKLNFQKSNYYKFTFCRKKIQGLPYFYDTISTHMNRYHNKSEHNRHEILISEICKLRAYLLKYKTENNSDIIKDFLIKHNIPNLEKYTSYQLMQFERFVCQEDIYKINSLLKPYMNIKDMINDILNNSENFNKQFGSFKMNSSVKNLLKNIKINKSDSFTKNNEISQRTNKSEREKNKVFYISELNSVTFHKEKEKEEENNSNVKDDILLQNENEINKKQKSDENRTNINSKIIEDKKIIENNKKDFKEYSHKRKEILKNIGLKKKYKIKSNSIENKESYFSPLFNRKTLELSYYNHLKKFKLPKISNSLFSIGTFYKPNKALLSPDKNYSYNFALLCKDVSNELSNFQNEYEHKFQDDVQRDIKYSEENMNKNNFLIKQKLKNNMRLFFGKKNIKVDLEEIQRKHKLTEYFALLKAKKHIKDNIINDNVINY